MNRLQLSDSTPRCANRVSGLFDTQSAFDRYEYDVLSGESLDDKELVINAKRLGAEVLESRNLCRQVRKPVAHSRERSGVVIVFVRRVGDTLLKAIAQPFQTATSSWIIYGGSLSRAGEAGKERSFLNRAVRLDERGHTDTALDIIFDQINEMFQHGQFAEVDQLLSEVKTENYSVDILLALLTASLPARQMLQNRSAFYMAVAKTLAARGDLEDGLLIGLE